MGGKQSKSSGQQIESKEEASRQNNFVVYLLPDNKEETLVKAQVLVAAQGNGSNAVLLFPDPNEPLDSSTETQKYNACFIRDGQWIQEGNERKEVSIGKHNFTHAKKMLPDSIKNPKNITKA